MKKRVLALLVALAMLLSMLAGCGNKSAEQKISNDYSAYTGTWMSDEASMDVDYNENDIINISFFLPNGDGTKIASIDLSVLISSIVDNTVSMAFEDSCGTTGTVNLTFENNKIIFEVKDITSGGDLWGVYEGVFEFSRDEIQGDGQEVIESAYFDSTNADVYENAYLNNEIDFNKIKNDLLENGANVLKINNIDESLDIVSIQIEKSKEYISAIDGWLLVKLKNDFYEVDAKFEVMYQYYDIGGWIMESCDMYEHKTTPIKFEPSDDKIHSECKKLFTAHEIIDREYTVNEKNEPTHITTFLGTWEAKYVTETHKGIRTFTFVGDNWIESWEFEKYSIDFSRLLGTWQFKHYDEYVKINITDVTKEKDSYYVTYDYQTSPWCDDGRWGGYITNSSYKTNGSSRTEPSKKVKVEFYLEEELDYYKAEGHYGGWYDKLKRIDQLEIRYSWGNWKDSYGNDVYNLVRIDVKDGLYINGFHYGYKNEQYVKPEAGTYYETWWGGDDMTKTVYFTKERNTGEVEDAMKKLKEMNN